MSLPKMGGDVFLDDDVRAGLSKISGELNQLIDSGVNHGADKEDVRWFEG